MLMEDTRPSLSTRLVYVPFRFLTASKGSNEIYFPAFLGLTVFAFCSIHLVQEIQRNDGMAASLGYFIVLKSFELPVLFAKRWKTFS